MFGIGKRRKAKELENLYSFDIFDIFLKTFRNQPALGALPFGKNEVEAYMMFLRDERSSKLQSGQKTIRASVASFVGAYFANLSVETQDEIVRILPKTERRERAIRAALEQVDNLVNKRIKEIYGG